MHNPKTTKSPAGENSPASVHSISLLDILESSGFQDQSPGCRAPLKPKRPQAQVRYPAASAAAAPMTIAVRPSNSTSSNRPAITASPQR